MACTYNFSTAPYLSWVRLLIADTNCTTATFSDDEINQFLYLTSSQALYVSGQAAPNGAQLQAPIVPQVYSVYQASALALMSLSGLRARQYVKKLLDVELDIKVAVSGLREIAKGFQDIEDRMGQFAIAEMVPDEFAMRERITNQLIRLYGTG